MYRYHVLDDACTFVISPFSPLVYPICVYFTSHPLVVVHCIYFVLNYIFFRMELRRAEEAKGHLQREEEEARRVSGRLSTRD